jgi:FtsH-binding integral membrane protein
MKNAILLLLASVVGVLLIVGFTTTLDPSEFGSFLLGAAYALGFWVSFEAMCWLTKGE